jgi:hypothetical protein
MWVCQSVQVCGYACKRVCRLWVCHSVHICHSVQISRYASFMHWFKSWWVCPGQGLCCVLVSMSQRRYDMPRENWLSVPFLTKGLCWVSISWRMSYTSSECVLVRVYADVYALCPGECVLVRVYALCRDECCFMLLRYRNFFLDPPTAKHTLSASTSRLFFIFISDFFFLLSSDCVIDSALFQIYSWLILCSGCCFFLLY